MNAVSVNNEKTRYNHEFDSRLKKKIHSFCRSVKNNSSNNGKKNCILCSFLLPFMEQYHNQD